MVEWRQCREFPNYEVSNTGLVRNINTGRILKTGFDEKGREQVILSRRGRQHNRRIHRLVADAFCEQYYEGLDVTHVDGNISNNDADNLEWRRRSDIARRSHRRLKRDQSHKMKSILCLETGTKYDSIDAASKDLRISRTAISRVINCRSFTTKEGYHFIEIS